MCEAPEKLLRVAALHDLSCFGRCALTVILPTLSAMGKQVIPIPTALLSTHTGGFENLYFTDLSDSMTRIIDHFAELPVTFDALYSGFLGSARQIGIVSDFFDRFRGERGLVLVDPVMGDDGKVYATYTPELVQGMRTLCEKADLLTPNLTEACLLIGEPYRDTEKMDAGAAGAYAEHLCDALTARFGVKDYVITGLICGGEMLTCARQGTDGETCLIRHERLPRSFPGTGDVFASVLLGYRMEGRTLARAVRGAADFTHDVIARSQNTASPLRDGVLLEDCLGELTKRTARN